MISGKSVEFFRGDQVYRNFTSKRQRESLQIFQSQISDENTKNCKRQATCKPWKISKTLAPIACLHMCEVLLYQSIPNFNIPPCTIPGNKAFQYSFGHIPTSQVKNWFSGVFTGLLHANDK